MLDANPIDRPTSPWVDRLSVGSWVYLIKEDQFAEVVWRWMPCSSSGWVGQIGINRFSRDKTLIGDGTWYVTKDGCGLDGKPIISPLGNTFAIDSFAGRKFDMDFEDF